MTARHASPVRSPRLALAGLLVSVAAVAGIFTHIGAAHADSSPTGSTSPVISDPTGACIPIVDPTCVLPTDTASATDTASSLPTSVITGPPIGLPSDTVSETFSIPDPTTAAPSSAESSMSAIPPSQTAASSSAAVPVGTLGTQDPNQDAPIQTAQQCGGLLCASTGYEAASTVQAAPAAARPTLANTGSADRLTVELSLGLLVAGLAMLAASSRRVAVAVGRRRSRRRH